MANLDQKNEEFEKSYNKYLSKDDFIVNDRIRPDDQNFFDALASEDMKNDPDRQRGIEIIRTL